MPKIVDHDAQRHEIAAAAIEWIARHGVETLSQRNVAALAGRSKGNVQHYFPDKASLMLGALKRITRVREAREQTLDGDPFRSLAERLYAVLPLSEAQADEWRVRLSLYVYAANDAGMQAYLADHARQVFVRGTGDVRRCQEVGSIAGDLDPGVTFRRLSAAVSGIAVAALANGGALGAEEQRAMLGDVLKSIAGRNIEHLAPADDGGILAASGDHPAAATEASRC